MSRNSAFITALMESKVKFVCCDMPEASEFTITIMAALAAVEAKRISISSNTKAALAAKREWYKANFCLGRQRQATNLLKDLEIVSLRYPRQ